MIWPFRRRRDPVTDEIRAHLAMAERDRVEQGESPEDARAHTRREFGNVALVTEIVRDVSRWSAVDRLFGDVRHASRRVRSSAAASAAIVAMLSLAIGITTAMFTVVDALLIRPLPFPESERLVHIFMGTAKGGRTTVAPQVLRAWRDSPAFTSAEGTATTTSVFDVEGHVATLTAALVTPGLFDMLGIRPIRGRLFEASEGVAAADTVLISERVWRGALGADPAAVGRRVSLDGTPLVIVGILPAAFTFPTWDTQVWRPADDSPGAPPILKAVLRIAPHVPVAEALAIATERAHEADRITAKLHAVSRPLVRTESSASYRTAVAMLAGGVLMVFLVLCANASSLLLARFNGRRREFSLCMALGASRGRLLRQALVEAGMLGGLGGVVGVGLAWGFVAVARGSLPEAFLARTLNPLDLDARALAIAIGAGLVAALAAGLLPAVVGTRMAPASSLRLIERGATESRSARVLIRTLLIGEVALACALLVGATLLVRSFVNLARADRGFDPRGIVAVNLSLGAGVAIPLTAAQEAALTPSDRVARTRAVLGIGDRPASASRAAIEDAIRALPGVQQVEWSQGGPMTDSNDDHFGDWRSDLPGAPLIALTVEGSHVGPNFFEMYGIRLRLGRTFQPGDDPTAVVIGERLASALFPGVNPIGHSFGRDEDRGKFQIVGVAAETHRPSIDADLDNPEFYQPVDLTFVPRTLSLRCASHCPSEALIRQRLLASIPFLAVYSVRRLDDAYARDLAQPRATALLASGFGVVALAAVAGGLFSVLSYAVGRRRREFGIRIALGSSPGQIRRTVLRDGVAVALAGIGLGSAAGWFLMRALASLQYGVTAGDPLTWGVVVAVLLATTLAASWRPAHQAMRVDPATLLREE